MAKPSRDDVAQAFHGLGVGTAGASHPLGEDFPYEEEENVYRLDPALIREEGPYVRQWFVDSEFEAFCAAVAENGDVGQPIGIRRDGDISELKPILVYGMRRLRAAKRARESGALQTVLVRDYGNISEREAVILQMAENELRTDPHCVDTAYGYHLLKAAGWSQKEISQRQGRDPGYVSVMSRMGESIALLSQGQRDRLYESPRVSVRLFQQITAAEPTSAPARRDLLLRELEGRQSRARSSDTTPRPPVQQRQHRDGGRTLKLRWKDDHIRDDALGLVNSVAMGFVEEFEKIVERLAHHREALGGRESFDAALDRAERHLESLSALRENGPDATS